MIFFPKAKTQTRMVAHNQVNLKMPCPSLTKMDHQKLMILMWVEMMLLLILIVPTIKTEQLKEFVILMLLQFLLMFSLPFHLMKLMLLQELIKLMMMKMLEEMKLSKK